MTPSEKQRLRDAYRNQAMRALTASPSTLREMCERWGTRPPTDFDELESEHQNERVTLSEWLPEHNASLVAFDEANDAKPVELLERTIEVPDEEVGRPGTLTAAGIIRAEPSYRLSPYIARGASSCPGIYDEHYRKPLVYKSQQSIRELLVAGAWDIEIPDDVNEDQREEVERAVREIWRALHNTTDGWEHYLEHAASCVHMGFAPFEVVWSDDDLPKRIAFREQSTVNSWLFDGDFRELAGARFLVGGDASTNYALPATGERLRDRRLIVVTLGGRGLNVEGVPPTRVVDALLCKKELILTIQAACAERFGAPILVAGFDEKVASALAGAGVMNNGEADRRDFFDQLADMMALDTPTFSVPAGLKAYYVNPAGTPPDFGDQLEYIDSQVMLAFSNQGALLGQQSVHGSYALAEVAADDFLSSAPYYARIVSRPINQLIRDILRLKYQLTLDAYPRLVWRRGGAADTSRWIADLVALESVRAQLPDVVLGAALEKLGLPADAYKQTEEPKLVEEPAEDVSE